MSPPAQVPQHHQHQPHLATGGQLPPTGSDPGTVCGQAGVKMRSRGGQPIADGYTSTCNLLTDDVGRGRLTYPPEASPIRGDQNALIRRADPPSVRLKSTQWAPVRAPVPTGSDEHPPILGCRGVAGFNWSVRRLTPCLHLGLSRRLTSSLAAGRPGAARCAVSIRALTSDQARVTH